MIPDKRMKDGFSKVCQQCKKEKEKTTARARQQRYRQSKGKDRRKEWVKYFYGITSTEFTKLVEEQNNCCKICGLPADLSNKKTLFIDHCHTTGNVRGLLCNYCNTGLGMFKDNAELLTKAIEYLNEASNRYRNRQQSE